MKGKKEWRLSRTLKRNVETRPIEDADVKYAYAAYKKKALEPMGPPFDSEMDAAQFKSAFEQYVLTNATAAWTIITNTSRGRMPVGFVMGDNVGALYIILGIVWFPWASKRNIVEGTIEFFNRIRKELAYMLLASKEHKRVYEAACAHGIMCRVGTSHQTGKPVAVYEGRL